MIETIFLCFFCARVNTLSCIPKEELPDLWSPFKVQKGINRESEVVEKYSVCEFCVISHRSHDWVVQKTPSLLMDKGVISNLKHNWIWESCSKQHERALALQSPWMEEPN